MNPSPCGRRDPPRSGLPARSWCRRCSSALWWYTAKDSTSLFYPTLGEVIDALREQWLFEQVGSDLVPSLIRLGLGYVLAATVGIALGLLLGLTPWLQRATQPVVEFVRAIPPPLLIPFVVVVLASSGTLSKVVIIALGSVWPVLLNTITGVRSVDRQLIDMAVSYGVPPRQRLWRIIVPGASPHIMVGLRTALAIAIILMVISEMRGTRERRRLPRPRGAARLRRGRDRRRDHRHRRRRRRPQLRLRRRRAPDHALVPRLPRPARRGRGSVSAASVTEGRCWSSTAWA